MILRDWIKIIKALHLFRTLSLQAGLCRVQVSRPPSWRRVGTGHYAMRSEPWGSLPDREVPSDAGVERGRDQLTTMVSVDRLTRPPHSIRGGQPPQHVKVVQDQFHQDILAPAPGPRHTPGGWA